MADQSEQSSSGRRRDTRVLKNAKANWDCLLASFGDISDSEKINKLEGEFIKLYGEVSDVTRESKFKDRTITCLQKDYKQSQSDLNRAILGRTKMENLARELQKHNKEIKDENYNRLKEEEEKRKAVAASFSEKLNSIASIMDENKDKSVRLQEENLSMTAKLSELYNQFQERDTSLSNMNSKIELQRELYETQMQQSKLQFEVERELWVKDRAQIINNLRKSEETNKTLQENVGTLQDHLNTYQKQYSEFKTTMERSNQVFDNVKDEMSKMQKSNALLEKDRNDWQSRWQSGTQTIVQLTELHQKSTEDINKLKRRLAMLERLCRQLNTERSSYLQSLKDNNITPIVPTEDIPMPPFRNVSPPINRPSKKEKQLMSLKKDLKKLEQQHKVTLSKEMQDLSIFAPSDVSIPLPPVIHRCTEDLQNTEVFMDVGTSKAPETVTSATVNNLNNYMVLQDRSASQPLPATVTSGAFDLSNNSGEIMGKSTATYQTPIGSEVLMIRKQGISFGNDADVTQDATFANATPE